MKSFGLIGLGKMGLNAAILAKSQNLNVIGMDKNYEQLKKAENHGIVVVDNLDQLLKKLEKPRIIMCLLPPGEVTKNTIQSLIETLDENDTIIDAGNSYYRDAIYFYKKAKERKINFADVGNNNGTESALKGACLTVGADQDVYDKINFVLEALSAKDGVIHTGDVGSGHFVKAVHNAIEYGMMQAIAEGLEIIKEGPFVNVDLAKLTKVWNQGSVIRCWLLDLLHEGLTQSINLQEYSSEVNATGQGLWTVQSALSQKTPAPVLTMSLIMRFRSEQTNSFACQVLNCLREKFGGHIVAKKSIT